MTLPLRLTVDTVDLTLRRAVEADVPSIVALLAADQLGSRREGIRDKSDALAYLQAFRAIDADANHVLIVAVREDTVVATLQLSFLPGLARRGSVRAQVEAVRVAADLRNRGVGEAMMTWVIDESRRRGCSLVQLTTDKHRLDAQRFYARLGFAATHEGMKLLL